MKKATINLKRVYEKPEKSDGFRILIDRLWPRGVSKEKARVDLWMKEIAPSNELRKWFGHNPKKWNEFISRYKLEISNSKDTVKTLKQLLSQKKNATLLYSASDEKNNNAVALKKILRI